MRLIIIIIIIGALGYFGYQYYEENMAGEPAAEAVVEVETMVDESDEVLEEATSDMVEEGEAVVEELAEEGEVMADDAGDAEAEEEPVAEDE